MKEEESPRQEGRRIKKPSSEHSGGPLDDWSQTGLSADAREFYERKDPEDNRDTTPPDDERIEVHSVWVAECYAPSHTPSLLSGVKKLGWDRERIGDFFAGGVSGWLEEGRGSPSGGSSFNLGIIEGPGHKRFVGPDLKVAELPAGVDYAQGYAYNVLSSLTVMSMQFVLTDEAASTLEEPLRTPRRTTAEQRGAIIRHLTVVNQKQEAVEEARVELRQTCANWFRTNLPGLFSSDTLGGDFPTCEFVTLQQARPFDRPPEGTPPDNYLWLLRMDLDTDVWDSAAFPGLRLMVPLGGFERSPYALVLAGKEGEIAPDEDFSMYGGRNRAGYTGWLGERVDGLLTVWSLHTLLRAYERQLASVRDRAGALDLRDPANSAEKLQAIQADLVGLSSDLLPLSSELTDFSETEYPTNRYAEEFEPAMQFLRERGLRLIEDLHKSISTRSKRVRGLEAEVRQVLMTVGTVASTISQERATQENLRLQGQVARLTKVLVGLTIALTVLGVLTIIATVAVASLG